MTTDWKSLAKETVHSFDADEVRGMWDVDWQRARSVFLADHEAEIAAEPRRWKKVLRKTNAIVFGLAKRLAPPRRLVFAFVLLLTLLAFVESFGGDSWSGQASWGFFALFVSVLGPGETLLFHSDGLPEARGASGEEFGDARIEHFLFRKAGAAPSEVVSSLVRELDRFLGRAACDDDVSIAAIRHKTA